MLYHHVYENPGFAKFQFAGCRNSCFLHYVRKGALYFKHPAFGCQLLPENHFQVYFFDNPLQTFVFTGTEKYSLMSINFPLYIMSPLIQLSFNAANFIHTSSGNSAAQLFDRPLHTSPENKRLLQDIFMENWSQEQINNIVSLILATTIQAAASPSNCHPIFQAATDDPVYAAAEWILLNVDEAVSIDLLARKFFINDFKLKQRFREIFGVPIITFQRKARIEKAKQLLLHTELTVSQIAPMVGFRHSTYFSDFFKRETNCSPTDFRAAKSFSEIASSTGPEKLHRYF